MNVPELAQILSSHFIGFKGSETELLRELFAHSKPDALRDVPSNPRSFRLALTTIAPELLVLGVSLNIFPTGMIHVKSASVAQTEATAEAALRANFFSALPEAAALRAEFGHSESGFQRFAAFRRGLSSGQIKPPLRGRNVLAAEDKGEHAPVDPRLPLEKQLEERWNQEPATRAAYSSFEAFAAFERANARGLVRKLG